MPFPKVENYVEDEATDQPEINTEESSSSAEDSESVLEPGEQSGEGQPEQSGETAEQAAAAQRTPPVDDSKLPFSQHPRWKEVYGERKKFEGELKATKQTLDQLGELGIKTREDAEFILNKARQAEAQHAEFTGLLNSDPRSFAVKLNQTYPDAYKQMYGDISEAFLESKVQQFLKNPTGDGRDQDRAAFLQEIIGEIKQNGQKTSQAAQRPQDQGQRAFQQERETFYKQQDDSWRNDVTSGVHAEVNGRIENLTKGFSFIDKDQKAHFIDMVFGKVNEVINNDRIFLDRSDQMLSEKARTPEQRASIVKAWSARVSNGGLLEKAIADSARVFALRARSAEEQRSSTVADASRRREVSSAGGTGRRDNSKESERKARADRLREKYRGDSAGFKRALLGSEDREVV